MTLLTLWGRGALWAWGAHFRRVLLLPDVSKRRDDTGSSGFRKIVSWLQFVPPQVKKPTVGMVHIRGREK